MVLVNLKEGEKGIRIKHDSALPFRICIGPGWIQVTPMDGHDAAQNKFKHSIAVMAPFKVIK